VRSRTASAEPIDDSEGKAHRPWEWRDCKPERLEVEGHVWMMVGALPGIGAGHPPRQSRRTANRDSAYGRQMAGALPSKFAGHDVSCPYDRKPVTTRTYSCASGWRRRGGRRRIGTRWLLLLLYLRRSRTSRQGIQCFSNEPKRLLVCCGSPATFVRKCIIENPFRTASVS